jgi:two-component system LytT family sensor kinase
MPSPPRTTWLLVFGFAAAVLFFGSQTVLLNLSAGVHFKWWRVFLPAVFAWSTWAALAPIVFFVARRFPFRRRRRDALVHVLTAAVLTTVHLAVVWVLLGTFGFPARRLPLYSFALYQVHADLVTYVVLVGAWHARDWYARYRDRELRSAQLESRLAQARLEGLRMQLQPHFLFNTLHSISALMHRDVEAADRMLTRLSDLLRLTLESAATPEVPLSQELDFLDAYLEIQQTRFEDRLTIVRDIDPEALDALVPNLLLQPLVENAIRHGVATRAAGGRVEISARRDDGRITLSVRDDGPGLAPGAPQGVGLSNTRARLEHLYGDAQSLALADDPAGGVRVTVVAPYRSSS